MHIRGFQSIIFMLSSVLYLFMNCIDSDVYSKFLQVFEGHIALLQAGLAYASVACLVYI